MLILSVPCVGHSYHGDERQQDKHAIHNVANEEQFPFFLLLLFVFLAATIAHFGRLGGIVPDPDEIVQAMEKLRKVAK